MKSAIEYIGYYEEVVPDVLCKDIINYDFNFQPSTYSDSKGITENSRDRVSMDEAWLQKENVYYTAIAAAFGFTIKKYSETHSLFDCHHITDFRINRYLKDGFMSSHIDNIHHSHGQQYGYPQVSVLLFLNADYEGGEFVVADNIYYPTKGSGIVFPSNFMFPHEVKPIVEGTRWSIIAWLM